MKISNAKNIKVGNNSLPNMSNTIKSWFLPITFGVVSYIIKNYEKVVSIDYIDTKGVVQPAGYQILNMLPEGDRNWEILEIHCLPDLLLKVGEFLFYNNKKYKVLKREDYQVYGYIHYIIEEAFDDE